MKIAIASGKGGTGKTTLSTNLALRSAEQHPTVLVDLDVEEPNSGLFLRGTVTTEKPIHRMVPDWQQEGCSLCGKCQQVCNFNAIIKLPDSVMSFSQLCHGCYACSELCPTGSLPMQPVAAGSLRQLRITPNEADRELHYQELHFIEGKLNVGEEQAVPIISQTIEYSNNNSPDSCLRIYDAPPGTSCPMIEAVKDADLVILVTEPTPFGFHDLQLAVETVRQMEKPFCVVLNKDGIGDDRVLRYCASKQIPVPARLPNDRAIAELYSRGETVYRQHRRFREELDKLIDWIDNCREGASHE